MRATISKPADRFIPSLASTSIGTQRCQPKGLQNIDPYLVLNQNQRNQSKGMLWISLSQEKQMRCKTPLLTADVVCSAIIFHQSALPLCGVVRAFGPRKYLPSHRFLHLRAIIVVRRLSGCVPSI